MAAANGQETRLNEILQRLETYGVVSVSELSKTLETSVVTVRKDLRLLEERQQLTRITGGAIPYQGPMHRPDGPAAGETLPLKQAVARAAAELIQNGDSLIVTSGTTPHLTLSYAAARTDLKILTDSLNIATDFCSRSDYQVIILGGEIYTASAFVHGRDAVKQAGLYMADKAIVTMDGVDPEAGLTTLRVEGADTLKSILTRARMRIVAADITKIGVESFCNIGDITLANVLVTNRTRDPEKLAVLERIAAKGVTIQYADETP